MSQIGQRKSYKTCEPHGRKRIERRSGCQTRPRAPENNSARLCLTLLYRSAKREFRLIQTKGSSSSASKHLELHAADPGRNEANVLCRFLGKIDQPATCVRTTIVDPHHNRLVSRFVRHADARSERQGPVSGGQIVHVEGLTVRCLAPVEAGSVPGSHSGLLLPGRAAFVRQSDRYHRQRSDCCNCSLANEFRLDQGSPRNGTCLIVTCRLDADCSRRNESIALVLPAPRFERDLATDACRDRQVSAT